MHVACLYVLMSLCVCARVYVCRYAYIQTRTCTYTHEHTRTKATAHRGTLSPPTHSHRDTLNTHRFANRQQVHGPRTLSTQHPALLRGRYPKALMHPPRQLLARDPPGWHGQVARYVQGTMWQGCMTARGRMTPSGRTRMQRARTGIAAAASAAGCREEDNAERDPARLIWRQARQARHAV